MLRNMSRFTRNLIPFDRGALAVLLCGILVTSCSEERDSAGVRRVLTNRDFFLEAQRVKKKLGDQFIVEVEEPFIVAGNISRSEFNRIKNGTVLSSYQAFYRQFFRVRPNYIIKVYLFNDDATYRECARKLFGDEPTTPFGYYKRENRSLVMNIATGTGTLVHEMTHALVEADFPQIPAWFNEGLGSLFEQCMVTSQGLRGLVNWRLPVLQRAIEKKKLTGLRNLVATTPTEFYRDERGTHYAEARYFCMYMQELGLLEDFYKTFRADFNDDPTGAETIENLLGRDLDRIQQDWLKWVATLSYPR